MEIGIQHKYFMNILLDFKPEDSPLTARSRGSHAPKPRPRESGNPCSSVFGFPLAGLLSEPIKIIQSPE